MTVTTTVIPPELISTICSNCGYTLDGLKPDTVCPECGRAQRPNEVVLYGWARGKHESVSNAKPSRLVWAVLGGNCWLAIYGAMIGGWVGKLEIIAVLFPLVWLVVARRESVRDGKIQVRLTAAGCVQYDRTTGRSPVQELAIGYRWVLFPLAMLLLLVWVASHHAVGNVIWFGIGFIIAAALLPGEWRKSRAFQAARRLLADNAIMDCNAIYYAVTTWPFVGNYTLTQMSTGRYRLQLHELYRYRVSMGANVIDAEIELPDETADLLRALLNYWLGKRSRD